MYNHILDQETFGRVVSCGPTEATQLFDLARQAVKLFLNELDETQVGERVYMSDGGYYCCAQIKDLAVILKVTPFRTGRVLREMGLRMNRTNTGYEVLFNRAQVDLLATALGVRNE